MASERQTTHSQPGLWRGLQGGETRPPPTAAPPGHPQELLTMAEGPPAPVNPPIPAAQQHLTATSGSLQGRRT